jgi:acetoin utilization protein AcuB
MPPHRLTVRDYMTPDPIAVEQSTSLEEAQRTMRERGIRHLPIVDGGALVGVLSERDVHLARSLRAVDHAQLEAGEAMTKNPITCTSTMALGEVARLMENFRCGSMLVVDDGRLVGIFTTVDAMRALAEMVEEKEGRDEADALGFAAAFAGSAR